MVKKTVHWTIDEEIIARIKNECGDLIPDSRFVNNILKLFLSSDDPVALRFEQYRRTHGNRQVPHVVEEIVKRGLRDNK